MEIFHFGDDLSNYSSETFAKNVLHLQRELMS